MRTFVNLMQLSDPTSSKMVLLLDRVVSFQSTIIQPVMYRGPLGSVIMMRDAHVCELLK